MNVLNVFFPSEEVESVSFHQNLLIDVLIIIKTISVVFVQQNIHYLKINAFRLKYPIVNFP